MDGEPSAATAERDQTTSFRLSNGMVGWTQGHQARERALPETKLILRLKAVEGSLRRFRLHMANFHPVSGKIAKPSEIFEPLNNPIRTQRLPASLRDGPSAIRGRELRWSIPRPTRPFSDSLLASPISSSESLRVLRMGSQAGFWQVVDDSRVKARHSLSTGIDTRQSSRLELSGGWELDFDGFSRRGVLGELNAVLT